MPRLSDSDDEPPPETQRYSGRKRHVSDTESSGDEDPKTVVRSVKRPRFNTLCASSQSSSGPDNSASENLSQPESDGEAPPSFGSSFNRLAQMESAEAPKSSFSSIGERIMRGKGYVEGKGLGKFGQGRVEPIEASTQRGRVGFGFQPFSKGQEYTGPGYDPNMEAISAAEEPIWMDRCPDEELDRDLLDSWMRTGPKKMTIDDEGDFCDPEILQDILSLKTGLDSLKPEELRRIRSACNPFEKIGKVFFINRAALKMANLDAVFDFMFTNPKNEQNQPLVGPKDLLYFADVCAGPGGFTEYVLWKKKWIAKGFGFTLKASNDFKLAELHSVSTETFTAYYGDNEDGDIFNPRNLESLKKFILTNTNDQGVHFLMGDGGFSVDGQENIQEILSKQLYVCQCIAALSVVRVGGNFVVKLFDVFTGFSVGLIYLMYKSFDRICIHKPNTSRPANSERYLICKGKRASSDTIERYLIHVNNLLWNCSHRKDKDVTVLVSPEVIKNDKKFLQYIIDSNNRIGQQQKVSLLKVLDCYKDPKSVNESRHNEMRTACLKHWEVPDKVRIISHQSNCRNSLKALSDIIQEETGMTLDGETLVQRLVFKPKIVKSGRDLLITPSNKSPITSLHDWKFIFLNNLSDETTDNKFRFYMGSRGTNVFYLDGKHWRVTQEFRLPADTLILAEKTKENSSEGHGIRWTSSLHIIDAFVLGGNCVFHKPLQERFDIIELFCRAHNRPQISGDLAGDAKTLRCKKLFRLENLVNEINKLVKRKLKRMEVANTTPVPYLFDNSDKYYVTKSVLVMKDIKEPWTVAYSKTYSKLYFFNSHDGSTSYEPVVGAALDTFGTLKSQLEWPNVDNECREDPMIYLLTNREPPFKR